MVYKDRQRSIVKNGCDPGFGARQHASTERYVQPQPDMFGDFAFGASVL